MLKAGEREKKKSSQPVNCTRGDGFGGVWELYGYMKAAGSVDLLLQFTLGTDKKSEAAKNTQMNYIMRCKKINVSIFGSKSKELAACCITWHWQAEFTHMYIKLYGSYGLLAYDRRHVQHKLRASVKDTLKEMKVYYSELTACRNQIEAQCL